MEAYFSSQDCAQPDISLPYTEITPTPFLDKLEQNKLSVHVLRTYQSFYWHFFYDIVVYKQYKNAL